MKKLLSIFLASTMVLTLFACSASENAQDGASLPSETQTEQIDQPEQSSQETQAQGQTTALEEQVPSEPDDSYGTSSILIAYFSWAENAVLDDDVDMIASPSVVPPGNVQQLAGWIYDKTGGDLFSIRVTDPYPSDWDECLERANEERGDDARPELIENVKNLESYDTVFLGYPNWWYGVPMALLSFLEQNDLSGKQVYLFCSHGTGGLANSVEIIADASPGAIISDNIFDCYEEDASSSQDEITDWLSELGY